MLRGQELARTELMKIGARAGVRVSPAMDGFYVRGLLSPETGEANPKMPLTEGFEEFRRGRAHRIRLMEADVPQRAAPGL